MALKGRKPKGDFATLDSSFSMRMPFEMRQKLERAAQENRRSLAQEILSRLDESFSSKWSDTLSLKEAGY